jgi:hypothetical protein
MKSASPFLNPEEDGYSFVWSVASYLSVDKPHHPTRPVSLSLRHKD